MTLIGSILTMKTQVQRTFMCLLLAAGITACDDTDVVDPPDSSAAAVSVYLTDAPGDVEAVWVEVEEIYLQGGGEEGGRTVLLDEPTELIELTSLAGTTHALVVDEEVEPGSYGQLRLVIGGAVLETTDGAVYTKDGAEHPDGLDATGDLMCPSCSQSGIKVLLQGEDLQLEEGDEDLLLDFDVSQTFGRPAGASGMWVMNPVIHGVDMVEMASISGTVAIAEDEEGEPLVTLPQCPEGTDRSLEDFVPTATAVNLTGDEGETIVRTGTTNGEGAFQILSLAPDEYTLGYVASIEFEGAELVWTADVDPASVTVAAGEDASGVSYTITGASCEVEEDDSGA